MVSSLRQQCAAELYVNAELYAGQDYLKKKPASAGCASRITSAPLTFGMTVSTPTVLTVSEPSLDDKVRVVKDEARPVLNGGEPSLLQAAALATVIKRPVHSFCLEQVSEECLTALVKSHKMNDATSELE